MSDKSSNLLLDKSLTTIASHGGGSCLTKVLTSSWTNLSPQSPVTVAAHVSVCQPGWGTVRMASFVGDTFGDQSHAIDFVADLKNA